MATHRLDIEITAVDPSGDMVFVEGRGESGVQLGLYIRPGEIDVAVGKRLAVTLATPEAAAPSLRERMGRPEAAPRKATAPPLSATRVPAGEARSDVSSMVMDAIFGKAPETSERDVYDEMDALLGKRR